MPLNNVFRVLFHYFIVFIICTVKTVGIPLVIVKQIELQLNVAAAYFAVLSQLLH